MAHFAQLDESNIVRAVVVVSNEVLNNAPGLEGEEIGIAFLKSLYGEDTIWKQTSYNRNFRGNYAALRGKYDPIKDEFDYPTVE